MKSWVIDCSLVLGWCMPDERSVISDRFFASLPEGATLLVPALFWYEVANALAAARRKKMISPQHAYRLVELISALPLTSESPRRETMAHLILLAGQHGLSAYDAAYLDLAVCTGSGIATLDSNLARVARSIGLPVAE